MASDTVQQIKDRLSIADVVGGYVKLERAGTSLRARCPFHAERTPSFHVSPERGTYHCFGCGVGGDIFTFVEAIEGLDFKGALKVLADRAGVTIEYSHGEAGEKDERDRLFSLLETATLFYATRLTDEARVYLRERGMTDVTITHFRLGFAGNAWSEASDYLRGKKFTEKEVIDAGLAKKNERGGLVDKFRNRIMFPISDSAGRVVGFSGRTFGPDASPEAPKYLNSPETPLFHKSRILYGFDKAKTAMRTLGCAVLVEGQVDLIMSHQAGWENTVAVSGTAFTGEHALIIKRLTDNLVIALDADEAGFKAASRAARAALQAGLNVKVARVPEGLDPADLIVKKGVDAWKQCIRDAHDIVEFLLDVLAEKFPPEQYGDRFRRAVEAAVLPFVTDVKSPIAREQYVRMVAGRLGVSETAVAQALAVVPKTADDTFVHDEGESRAVAAPLPSGRVHQAFGIILWQEHLKNSAVDTAQMRTALADALGAEMYARLDTMSEREKEGLRFDAERLYGERASLQQECADIINILLRDRLARELAEISARLKRAESAGDSASVEVLLEQSRLLTARIAQLHAPRYTP